MDSDLKAYVDRYRAVAEVQPQELRSASLELRWKQLNAIVGLAIGLGILKSDESEEEIYRLWATQKTILRTRFRNPDFASRAISSASALAWMSESFMFASHLLKI